MKKKLYCFVLAMILLVLPAAAFIHYNIFTPDLPKKENLIIPQIESGQNGYLSITYTTSSAYTETGRMINFYTYDLTANKLDNRAQIPYSSQYALGAVSLSDQKVYYSHREINDKGNADHLYEYNLLDGTSHLLETENHAYNDIVPVNGKLLVTTVPVHAIGTGIFDLNTKTFSYLYEKTLNEDGYIDFPYTTRPVALNYNFKYEKFVNVYVTENDIYDLDVRTGAKPLNFHIALANTNLKLESEYIFTITSWLDCDVTAASQISSDSVILIVQVPSSNDELESEYEFYKINFTEKSCKKIVSPFPNMRYVNNFITVDDGKSYYISGCTTNNVSGLLYYNCSNNNVKPILLDNPETDGHVVNFCLLKN